MAALYTNAAQYMQQLGFLDVIIPFIFAFTIVFAVIAKAQIFGKDSRKYGAVIALVMGLLFVYYVNFIDILFFASYVSILMISGLAVMMLMNFMGVESAGVKWATAIVSVAFVIIIGYDYIDWDIIRKVLINPATIACVIFILALWYIIHEKGGKAKKTGEVEKKEEKKPAKKEQKKPEEGEERKPLRIPPELYEQLRRMQQPPREQ